MSIEKKPTAPQTSTETQLRRWLSIDALVSRYGFRSRKAVYQRVRRGKLPAYKLGRHLRFLESEIDALILNNPVSVAEDLRDS